MVRTSCVPKGKLVELSPVVGYGGPHPAVFDWDRDKASSHDGGEAQCGTTLVTQLRCHCNDETVIVTEIQVTMLKPWRCRPHVKIVDAQLSLCTDVVSLRCTSTDPDLSCLVVSALLSTSNKQEFIRPSHSIHLRHLHTYKHTRFPFFQIVEQRHGWHGK